MSYKEVLSLQFLTLQKQMEHHLIHSHLIRLYCGMSVIICFFFLAIDFNYNPI